MKIQFIQKSFYPNRIKENTKIIADLLKKAETENCDILVAPSYAICGFAPGSFLRDSQYIDQCVKAAKKLIALCKKTALVFDFPAYDKSARLVHQLILAYEGTLVHGSEKSNFFEKMPLSERLWFHEGAKNHCFEYKNKSIYLCFAEELYAKQPIIHCDLLIASDACVYFYDQNKDRVEKIKSAISKIANKGIYVNQAGGQASWILSGGSFYVDNAPKTALEFHAEYFMEKIYTVDTACRSEFCDTKSPSYSDIEQIYKALTCGIRDYFKRIGAQKALIGLSGGIDSAVILPLAVKALGRQNVLGVLMPSQYSSDHSIRDAVRSAENLQVHYQIIPIRSIYHSFENELKDIFSGTKADTTEENIQARIRGSLLMAISNKYGYILLNTSNKSEAACGYGTLYGDLCGGLSVIGDLYKHQVYALAEYINRKKEIIPLNSIQKAPSAELRPDQKDSDSLPEYPIVDEILRLFLEEKADKKEMIKKGLPSAEVEKILRLLVNNEYKRRQCPPPLVVSSFALINRQEIPLLS